MSQRDVASARAWLWKAPPRWLGRQHVVCEAATPLLLLHLLGLVTYAGAFVFGSGLAIVPFLRGSVVLDQGWLTERQLLDAVAVAMITSKFAVLVSYES